MAEDVDTRDAAYALDELWEDAAASAPDPPRRRRGLLITAIVLAALLIAGAGYVVWAVTAPVAAPTLTEGTPPVPAPAALSLAAPTDDVWAIAVTGAADDLGADGLEASSGLDESRSIASITKLITALVVLDAHPLDSADDPGPTLTFSKADHDLYDVYYVQGAAIVEMPTGSRLSQHDALALMLVPSASNYADAVSTWAFGSRQAFLAATARWLDAHGLHSTTIVDPTGLSPRNTSTPRDLIEVGRIAAANPVVSALASSPQTSIPERGMFTNTNSLLGTMGVTGLKTGNLGEGAFTLLYTSRLVAGGGAELDSVGVVLGGANRASVDRDVAALLTSIRDGFQTVPLVHSGQVLGIYETVWGAQSRVIAGADTSIVVWSDTPVVMARDTIPTTDFRQDATVGHLTWSAGPRTASVDLLLEETIEPPTIWWRLTHPTLLGG